MVLKCNNIIKKTYKVNTMPNIEVRQEVYERLKLLSNRKGGRDRRKISMGTVIKEALDVQDKVNGW